MKAVRAGFRVEYATSFVSLLLPLMLASRGLKKSGAGMDEQMDAAGLTIGKLTNAVLGVIMRIEWVLEYTLCYVVSRPHSDWLLSTFGWVGVKR